MGVQLRKTRWGFDPDWLRVEALGDAEEHLGSVWFELRGKSLDEATARCVLPGKKRTLLWMAAATVLLVGSLWAGAW